jgi:hypothetical protein
LETGKGESPNPGIENPGIENPGIDMKSKSWNRITQAVVPSPKRELNLIFIHLDAILRPDSSPRADPIIAGANHPTKSTRLWESPHERRHFRGTRCAEGVADGCRARA